MDKRESSTGNKDSLRRGCGCFLVVVGAVIALFALLIAIASVIGEKQGYDRNETEWAEYNENLPVIDSLYEAGVPDSIIEARYPQPQIRQGGFAIIFGGLTALVVLVVGAIPLIVLLRKRKKKES